MKAVTYKKNGSPVLLHVNEVKKPTPKENEVLVKVQATTLNTGDYSRISMGLVRSNRITGSEFSGEIVMTGKQVKNYKSGDQVFGYVGMGAHAQYVCVPANAVMTKMPTGISYEAAAAVPNGALSALYFLKKGKIDKGQHVLINGASGSVGSFAVQLAKYYGATVTGVCSTSNIALVKALGADRVIDYIKEDFTANHNTFDLILDAVGKSSFSKCKNVLKPTGSYVSTAFNIPLLLQMVASGAIPGGKKVYTGIAKYTTEGLSIINELLTTGKIVPIIDSRYSLTEIDDAFRLVAKGTKKGNIIINV